MDANAMMRHAVTAILVLAVMAGIGVPPAPVVAQSSDVTLLRDRVSRLEQQLESMRRLLARPDAPAPSVGGGGSGPVDPMAGPAAAQMQVRLGEIETEMRRLTGRVEELDFAVRQMDQRLQTLSSDIDFRLRAVEQGRVLPPAAGSAEAPAGAAAPTAETTTDSPPAATTALPAGSPNQQYEQAIKLLKRAEYDEAETVLSAFIEAYPEDPLTGNALYWLGETHYVRGQFAQAAVRFADGYKRFPNHPKGPDNLLKLGMSLAKLDKKKEACASFGQLARQYPDAGASIKRTAATESKTIGCR